MTTPFVSARAAVVAVVLGTAILFLPDIGGVRIFGVVFDGRFVLINLCLLALAGMDVALAPSPTQISVRRLHPSATTLGSGATISWQLERGKGRRTVTASVADELAPSLGADNRRFVARVPPQSTVTSTVQLKPTRRGRFMFDRIVVRTHGPLGLVGKQRSFHAPTTLRVLPPFRSAEQAELSLKKARILEVGIRAARARGSGTDFDSLREMGPDDESRRIDWAATARTGKPIVRVYRTERNQTVTVLLDSGRAMAGRIADVPRIEHAMDGAMMLAELTTGLGDKMGLFAFDQTVHTTIPASNRRRQRSAIAEELFDLHPALVTSNYQHMVTHVLARQRRRALLVLMTDLEEQAVREFLLPALPMLVRTHVVVVASVSDPDIRYWMDLEVVDEESMFLRAAAIEEHHRRARVAAQLTAVGVRVIDEPPETYARVLGDLYLDIKSTGRL
ncbi:MAG: DUF58 domain-containing protein [Acidimicrobiales bacterium]|nr:DUF58 domain-containing protein [Acidimicrobiales bacterium]